MPSSSAPIGVFDSGIGGLNTLKTCVRVFPHENFCYFGDNEHAPYGEKSEAELRALLFRSLDLLSAEGAKAIVVACNTLSTNCLDDDFSFPVPVVGTFPPLDALPCEKLLLLATSATLRSRYCTERIDHFCARGGKIHTFFPSELVRDLEKNAPEWGRIGLERHFSPLPCDGVVPGCTHFLFLRKEIARFFQAPCFDGQEKVVENLRKAIENNQNMQKTAGRVYFVGKNEARNRSVFRSMNRF